MLTFACSPFAVRLGEKDKRRMAFDCLRFGMRKGDTRIEGCSSDEGDEGRISFSEETSVGGVDDGETEPMIAQKVKIETQNVQ